MEIAAVNQSTDISSDELNNAIPPVSSHIARNQSQQNLLNNVTMITSNETNKLV